MLIRPSELHHIRQQLPWRDLSSQCEWEVSDHGEAMSEQQEREREREMTFKAD